MEGDQPFDAEAFEVKLNALTVNSRAVIADLTIVAERYPGSCDVIVRLVENRIKRCLPHYKLNSIYLLDSIVKNVGSPYNVVFGRNLFRTFSETYLIVVDTPTRQSLINLFKTWKGAKTLGGVDLFAPEILARIEQFIIKATTIAAEAEQAAPLPARVSPDMLLRECRSLLEYCIALDKRADYLLQFPGLLSASQAQFFAESQVVRHAAVFNTNAACDAIVDLVRARELPDSLAQRFVGDLQQIRTLYDEQNFRHESIAQLLGAAIQEKVQEKAKVDRKARAKRQAMRYLEKNAIKHELLAPDLTLFELLEINPHDDLFLVKALDSFGHADRPVPEASTVLPPPSPPQVTPAELEASLLLGFGNFAPSLQQKLAAKPADEIDDPYSPPMLPTSMDSVDEPAGLAHFASPIDSAGTGPSTTTTNEEDDYIPSLQPDPYENEYPTNMPSLAQVGGIMRSSLKRESRDNLARVAKRVRFAI